MIYVSLALVAVLVSARSSAEWIPDVSEISELVVDQRPLAVGKRKLRAHDEATKKLDEERAGSPPHIDPELLAPLMRDGESSSATPLASIIESSIPLLMKDKSVLEPLSSNVPNKDVSHLKSDIEFTQRMERLDINVGDVVAAVQRVRKTEGLPEYMYNEYRLTLMVLGSEYFKRVERVGANIELIHPRRLEKVMKDYAHSARFKHWIADHAKSPVSIQNVYGKMRWLAEMGDFQMNDMEDLADMAFGSEFFKISKIELTLPSPIQGGGTIETLEQLKHQIEQLAKRHDVNSKVGDKLRAFAEDPGSIGITKNELLRRAKDAVLNDEVEHLKSNKALTQRMEELRINLDNAKVDVQRLREQPGLLKYDDISIYWMVLGSKYFEKVESSNIKSMHKQKFERAMGTDVSTELQLWTEGRKYSLIRIMGKIYGKMRWLKQDKYLKFLKSDELANMAFGSEFFPVYKKALGLPSPIQDVAKSETLEQLRHRIEQLTKRRDVDPKVKEKLRAFADDLDSIGNNEEMLLRRAKDAVFDDEVAHLKRNKAFTQRMEEARINIDDVKVAVKRLRKEPGLSKYDDYSLYLMALGSEYFNYVEKSGANIEPMSRYELKNGLGIYVDSEEFQTWKAFHASRRVATTKLYAKMQWLVKIEDFKSLEGNELAEMAFGSEYISASKIDLGLPSPRSETLDQLKHQIEQLTKRPDVNPKVGEKLRAFAEDPSFIGNNEEMLLRRAKDAVFDDEVDHLKSNKAFTQRMEELSINIDDVQVAVPKLREEPGLLKYDDFSVYLMALGSEYFNIAGANINPMRKKQFQSKLRAPTSSTSGNTKFLQYVQSDEFQRWKSRHTNSHVKFENVYAKMISLGEDQHFKSLEGNELLNMAFGSEFFKISNIKVPLLPSPIQDGDKIETLDQLKRLIIQMPKGGNGEPDVKQKLIDMLKEDPKTLLGQTAQQVKRKASHEALGVALGEETKNKRTKVV